MIAYKNQIQKLIQNIITSGTFEKSHIEVRRKIIMINIISIIGIINLIPLGIAAFIHNTSILGYFDLALAIVLIAIIFYLRKSGYHTFLSYFGVSITGVLFLYLFVTGGVHNTGHLWFYTFPLFASFLLGSKKGAIATFGLFIPSILFLAIGESSATIDAYTTAFKIRFALSFLVVFGYSFLFEHMRERTQEQLSQKNAELEEIISDLKKTDEALRESKERYRSLSKVTEEGIIFHHKGLVVDLNDSCAEIFGYERSELIGKNAIEIIALPEYQDIIYRNVASGYGQPYEVKARRKDGTIFPIEIQGKEARYKGEVLRVASIRDITEKKRVEKESRKLEARLLQAERMEAIGTLAGGVAHDLNNILSGLVSYPELLLMEIPKDNPLRSSILTIKKSGEKAATIVQDLLTLARRGVATTEVVRLNDIISEYLKSPEYGKLELYHPKCQVETRLEENLLNTLGSPVHLSKTVMNLVSNAAEAMPNGGKIFISTENRYIDRPVRGYDHVEAGDYVVLTVSDTGVGMSSDNMERIFEPFYTKKVMGRSGTGLGMAVVWGTIKDHKGYIDIQSNEGQGCTFTIYFPVTGQELHNHESHLSIEDYMGRGESILVVDDVKEQREIASRMLNKLGYSVTSVSCGEDAIEYLRSNAADLLVLDMIMHPGIDGYDTYKKILEFHHEQKAIITSGFSETDRLKETQRLGAGTYVKKPYSFEKIGLAVRTELDK